jgi:hypothetical protein
MMAKRALLILTLLTLTTAGCSNSWREGDSGRTPEEVAAYLDEVQNNSSSGTAVSGGSDVTTALQYRNEANIYFAEAPGALGPVGSILSFIDFGFLGSPNFTVQGMGIKQARVFFLDASPNFGLVVGLDKGAGFEYYGFSGQGSFDGDFEAVLSGSSGQITVQSDDIDVDILNDVIQLHVYDSQGGYIGKFSTLVGYTN